VISVCIDFSRAEVHPHHAQTHGKTADQKQGNEPVKQDGQHGVAMQCHGFNQK
jgi:hypothetical protein